MEWSDLLAAFALYLVLEGLMPFLNPAAFKRAMSSLLGFEDRVLRIVGLLSMLAGIALLTFVRGSH